MELNLKIADVVADGENSLWTRCSNCDYCMPLCDYCGMSFCPDDALLCEEDEGLHFCSEECAEYFNEQYEDEGEESL